MTIEGGQSVKRLLLLAVMLVCIIAAGCSNGGLSGTKPPKTFVEVGSERYETVLGTYCWTSMCVDTAGPIELMEGKETIKVQPGATITMGMDYEPQPSEISLYMYQENLETEVDIQDNQFTAPVEKGIYYYSYGVWWMSEEEENVSYGDAFYAFALEVEGGGNQCFSGK